jgi:hypothetical protein
VTDLLVADGGPDHARTSLPWIIQELDSCFVVIDNIGQKVAFVYFAHEVERRSNHVFSKDEAWRIAAQLTSGKNGRRTHCISKWQTCGNMPPFDLKMATRQSGILPSVMR